MKKRVVFSQWMLFVTLLGLSSLVYGQQLPNAGLGADLIKAADEGNTETVKLLLEKGADIEAKNDNDNTALIRAASGGYADTVKLLLKKGANIEAMDYFGNTVLIYTVSLGNRANFRYVLENKREKQTDPRWIATVKLLLEAGVNVNATNEDGVTALAWAAVMGQNDMVKLLLAKGADIEGGKKIKGLPLTAAVWAGRVDTVKLLLENGANIYVEVEGKSPAESAEELHEDEIVTILEKERIKRIANGPKGRETLNKEMEALQKLDTNMSGFGNFTALADWDRERMFKLIEEIIKLAKEIRPLPAAPKKLVEFEGRAEYITKNAKTNKDYLKAAEEYEKAMKLAPWVSSYSFNSGTLMEKGGHLRAAIDDFRLYLIAAPDAEDYREVRKRIAGLEAALEELKSLAGKWVDKKVLLSDGPLPYQINFVNAGDDMISMKAGILSADRINEISIEYTINENIGNQVYGRYHYENITRTDTSGSKYRAIYQKFCDTVGEIKDSKIILRNKNCSDIDLSGKPGPRLPRYDDLYDNSEREVILTR